MVLPIKQQPERLSLLGHLRPICEMIEMPRLRSANLMLRIEPELKAAAQRAAADDRRSLASIVEMLLSDYLRGKGYLRPK
jgi:hypothetical protein